MNGNKKIFLKTAAMVILAFAAAAAALFALKNFAPSHFLTASVADSQKSQLALRQFSKAVEASVKDADDKELSLAHRRERVRAYQCMLSIYNQPEALKIAREIIGKIVDTPAKKAAYLKANQYPSVKILNDLSEAGSTQDTERKFGCDFSQNASGN